MIKRILGILLSASIVCSSFAVLAENETPSAKGEQESGQIEAIPSAAEDSDIPVIEYDEELLPPPTEDGGEDMPIMDEEDAPVELMSYNTIYCKRRVKVWASSRGKVWLYRSPESTTVVDSWDCYATSDLEIDVDGYTHSSSVGDRFFFYDTNGKTGERVKYYMPYDNYKVTYVSISHTYGSAESAHPHYRRCDCGASYTTTKSSCTTCYPPYFYYNANGGSDAPSSQSGYPITISSTIPTRFPYKFTGWNFSGSSTKWYAGETYRGSANTNYYLYANWDSALTMTSSNNASNSTYLYPSNTIGYFKFVAPETATYAFESTGSVDTKGYIYNSSGTQLVYNDDGGEGTNFRASYSMTEGTTYYLGAKYLSSSATGTIYTKMRRQYEVKFDANGGTGAPSAQSKLYGDTVTLSNTEPTNGSFKFLGYSTSADSTEIEYQPGDSYTADADITLYAVWEPVTGQCGDNLYWTLTSDGTLTISGTGDMWNWEVVSSRPEWNEYRYSIKKVIINNGATTIGSYAFYGYNNLSSIEIPNSMTEIGKYALGACYNLTNIIIPDHVVSIGASAFAQCSGLTNISIPSSVTKVGGGAFWCCSSLTSIDVDENNPNYTSVDGNLFDKNKTILIQYAVGKQDGSYTIPNSVMRIGNQAFYGCRSLTTVTIPNSVTRIGNNAFHGCNGLTTVTIPYSVTNIDDYAFTYCNGLTSITIPNSVTRISTGMFYRCSSLTNVTIPDSVTNIDHHAFLDCENLKDVYFNGTKSKWDAITIAEENEPLTNATLHYILDEPTITITDLEIGKRVSILAKDGEWTQYVYNKNDVTNEQAVVESNRQSFDLLEEGEYYIGAKAIVPTDSIHSDSKYAEETVTIEKSQTPIASHESGQIVLGRTVELSTGNENSVIYYTTDGSTPTTSSTVYSRPITIDEPKMIKAISTTLGCAVSDEAVYIYSILGTAPSVLINISNIDGGKAVTLSNEIEEAKIYYTLDSTTPTENSELYTRPIEITSPGVKYIKAIAVIPDCKNSPVTSDIIAVEQLASPKSLIPAGRVQKGTAITLSADNGANIYYTTDGSVPTINSEKYTDAIVLDNSQTIKAIAVKKGYVSSETAEFKYDVYEKCTAPITMIKGNKGIWTAELNADEGADIYYTLDGSTPTALSEKYTEPIVLNEAKEYIIKSIAVKDGYENSDIEEKQWKLLKTNAPSANIESGRVEKGTEVTLSGDGTIYYTINSGSEIVYSSPITIEEDTVINAYAVRNDGSYIRSDTVEFNYRTEKITSGTDGGIVWNFDNETLTITGGGAIPDYTDNPLLWSELSEEVKYIVIEDGITAIGKNAFKDMNNVLSVIFPDSVTAIGNNAFDGCEKLTDINLPTSLISIGNEAFKNCAALTEIVVPDTIKSIGKGTFNGCANLKSITVPFVGSQQGSKNSKETFSYIFDGNVPLSLKKVTVTNEVYVPENAFKDCVNIENININNTIIGIGNGAFDGCMLLREFIIPDGISEIGDNTFRGCENAVIISVPDTVMSIGEAAFDGCRKLESINIPNSIMVINDYTFRNCSYLYEIEIPDTVESIGVNAMEGCSMLHVLKIPFVGANSNPGSTSVTAEGILGYLFGGDNSKVPASITKVEVTNPEYIPKEAFKDCANIVDVLIDGGGSVLDGAFENCRNLKNLYIPKSISTIGSNILANCVQLDTLTVPFIGKGRRDNNTETSVLGAFFGYDDNDITGTMQYYNTNNEYHYYKIPKTLKNVSVLSQTDIPYGAFMECGNLEQVSIVTGAAMNDYAFYNCAGLIRVILPKDLRTIGYEAFAECENLESVNLPNNTKSIGDNAFYNARALKEITIPRSVEDIAEDVFNGTGMFSAGDVQLFAAGGTIICAEGSKAHEFAIEKNINYTLVDDSELNIKQTSTTVKLLSDDSYLFNVTDPYSQIGTLHVDVYDKESNLLSAKITEADDVEYRISFKHEEVPDISYAMIYISDEDGEMLTSTTEIISVDGGEIPEIPESNIGLKYDKNSNEATVTGTNGFKRGMVLIEAVYDNDGALKNVTKYNVQGLNIPISVNAEFDETNIVKFMLWESFESMKPAADYLVI